MRKYLLTIILLSVIGVFQSQAQLSIASDTIETEVIPDVVEAIGHNTFTNQLPQIRTFRWIRTVHQITEGWTSAVCDENACYFEVTDSMDIQLGPGASSLLDVHLYLNGMNEGYSVIEVTVKDINMPTTTKSAVYIFSSDLTSGVEELTLADFKLYPNPTTNSFSINEKIENAAWISIHDPSGRELKKFPVEEGSQYDISNLAAGTYIIRVLDDGFKNLGNKLITKF
jgi:hypothetical protein